MDPASLHLSTHRLGALPLINHFLHRIGLPTLLGRLNADEPYRGPTPAQCLGVLLRNLILDRGPVYSLGDWGAPYQDDLLGLANGDAAHLNDDRVGRALDRLFDADRASLQTQLVVRVVREFHLDLSQFHNDSTTLTLQGKYAKATSGLQRGKPTLKAARGHSKDHRPDLKQLLWCLTVTADGAVPIHYKAYDGNTNDSPTHWETWASVQALRGSSDFLYVADSKGSASDFLQHVHAQGGRFIVVLPRTRNEDAAFRDWIQTHEPAWEVVAAAQEPGDDVWMAVEAPTPSAEGFRVVWVRSLHNAERDRRVRHQLVQRAVDRLQDLDRRLQSPRTKIRAREAVVRAAEGAVGGAQAWVSYEINQEDVGAFKQAGPGRPGKGTQYRRVARARFRVVAHTDEARLAYDAKSDGAFPLITNTKPPEYGLVRVFQAYKYQPYLEKRHEQLKTVYEAAPFYLKNITRIEALLFLYFAAMIVQALIERGVRQGMQREGIKSLPLYSEGRPCEAPTTDKVLAVFDPVQVHRLNEGGKEVKTFWPALSPLQTRLLRLAGVPEAGYGPNP